MIVRRKPPADAIVPSVVMQDVVIGRGLVALPGDTVSVSYVRKHLDGTPADSAGAHGTPAEFALGMGSVAKGLEDGVRGMRAGGTRKLAIPADHAYTEHGGQPIAAGATLVYDVELLRVR